MFQIKSFLFDFTSGPGFGEYYTTIPLTELLCKVLSLFLKRPNQIIPYDEIINEIWGEIEVKGQERLTQTIKRLRNNLADCPEITIENVRGYGYKLIIKA